MDTAQPSSNDYLLSLLAGPELMLRKVISNANTHPNASAYTLIYLSKSRKENLLLLFEFLQNFQDDCTSRAGRC